MNVNEIAATLHEHLCECPLHGYSQGNERWGTSMQVCSVEAGGKTYTLKGGDRDCSSSVIDCWSTALQGTAYEGRLDDATYTGNMRSVFVASGLFTWHALGDGYVAQTGDIYLNEVSHTAMCQSADPDWLSEFVINENGGITGGQSGDQTNYESYIHNYYNFPWDGVLAYNHLADKTALPNSLRQYKDLDPDAWYIPYAQKMVEGGIMTGKSDIEWRPNDSFTRAECIVTLSRKAAWGKVKCLPFNDVGAWYTEDINTAASMGIVDITAETFRPNDNATREEFSSFIWRAQKKPNATPYSGASEWAQEAVGWAIEQGIFTGDPRPHDTVTRAEAAAMLCRF